MTRLDDAVPGKPARRLTWIPYWVQAAGTITAIMIALAGLTEPMVIRARKEILPATEAVMNLRQVGIALFKFHEEYGSYPDSWTIEGVKGGMEKSWGFGRKTSNDYFRQLLASRIAESEVMFSAQTRPTPVKADNIFDSEAEALKKGECSFTYLLGGKATFSDKLKRPLVVVPMKPGSRLFDPKPFDGQAVILWTDRSVNTMPIDKNGHVILDGRDMMDPGHPIWDGKPPVIAWPDL